MRDLEKRLKQRPRNHFFPLGKIVLTDNRGKGMEGHDATYLLRGDGRDHQKRIYLGSGTDRANAGE